MDRRAEMVYLRDIRDLELTNQELSDKISRLKSEYFSKQKVLNTKIMPQRQHNNGAVKASLINLLLDIAFYVLFLIYLKPDTSMFVGFLILIALLGLGCVMIVYSQKLWYVYVALIVWGGVLAIAGLHYLYILAAGGETYAVQGLMLGLTLFMAIFNVVIPLIHGMADDKKTKKINEKYENDFKRALANQAIRARNAQSRQQEIQRAIPYYQNQQAKVKSLLNKLYNLNIIPRQYRNLESIWYIYDYMYTSRATLESTLYHADLARLESGIKQILNRLDDIVEQNAIIIGQNRRIEANTAETVNRTRNMLNELQRIESNTNEAAEYAAIASNYSAVCAFFSAADYLKK